MQDAKPVPESTGRTSFTYYLPAGMSVTYCGGPDSWVGWLRKTWIGGYGAWMVWLRCWRHHASAGDPRPSTATAEALRLFRRFSWEARCNAR